MKRSVRWYDYLFGILLLFIYIMGIYDFFMMLSKNADYYASHNYGYEAEIYFTSYPFYLMIFGPQTCCAELRLQFSCF